MAESLRLATEPYRNLAPATDTPERFQAVVDKFKDGFLQIPVHQRDATAWTGEKRQKYVERLQQSRTGSHPPGSFVTYQIVGNAHGASPEFLNDGFQRLTALHDLEAGPAKYGMDSEGVRQLLQQQISVQHRHYDSHQTAMRDFQLINNGTRLTSWELCIGFLKYMDGYETKWKPLLGEVEAAVADSSTRLIKKRELKREQAHKFRRHTWALFYRFLAQEKRLVHYQDVAASDVQPYVDRDSAIEQRLVVALGQYDGDVGQLGKSFAAFVAQETATLERLVRQTLADGIALAPTLHRWLLDLAVWRRFNKKSRDSHASFVRILLERTGGNSLWPREDATGNITINQLGHLPTLAQLAGMPEFCVAQRRTRKRNLRNGYDDSHLLPFVSNGDGPTVPEPAALNRARGAKPMEER